MEDAEAEVYEDFGQKVSCFGCPHAGKVACGRALPTACRETNIARPPCRST